MKIFSPEQIRQIEAATFNHPTRPIPYLDLMEDAGETFADWFLAFFQEVSHAAIFCGTGNNGGDGLVVARVLSQQGIQVSVILSKIGKATIGYKENLAKLPDHGKINIYQNQKDDNLDGLFQDIFKPEEETVIIDALFGIGLNRPITGYWAKLIDKINNQGLEIAAIDMPSGLFAETPTEGNVIQATATLTFQAPKLSFFFPENEQYLGEWSFDEIGLDSDAMDATPTKFFAITLNNLPEIPKRSTFSHKGTYGHSLIVGGQYGMAGAALLSTQAALRSGCGKVTVLTPSCNQTVLQLGAPEALLLPTHAERYIAPMNIFTSIYSAIGIGPGLGKHSDTVKFLRKICRNNGSFVLDADAINILSENPDIFNLLPQGTILTPHPKEFERIAGSWNNGFERLEKQKALSKKLGIFIIYKNANTTITTPDGIVYFNMTGNPGMAKGGTGDILTGYLTGLLARGLKPLDACILAVNNHALAGDAAAARLSMESMKASDLLGWL